MKKGITLILVAAIVLSLAVALFLVTPSSVSAGGMVENQSFESVLGDEWTVSGSAGRVCDGDAHEGTCAAEITAAGGSLTQWIGNVTPLGNYSLWGWIKATGSVMGYIQLDYWSRVDGNDTQLSQTYQILAANTGVYVEGNMTLPRSPVGTTHARIRLVETGWTDGSVLRFDDIGFNAPAGGCFIATAAYGTDTAEQIDVLRAFRDRVLLKDPLGSRFVSLYYKASPPVADYISHNSFLKAAVRELFVEPVVGIARLTEGIWGD